MSAARSYRVSMQEGTLRRLTLVAGGFLVAGFPNTLATPFFRQPGAGLTPTTR